jgi:hypothetical protein
LQYRMNVFAAGEVGRLRDHDGIEYRFCLRHVSAEEDLGGTIEVERWNFRTGKRLSASCSAAQAHTDERGDG